MAEREGTAMEPGTRVRDDTGTMVYTGTVARGDHYNPGRVIVEWDSERDGRKRTSALVGDLEIVAPERRDAAAREASDHALALVERVRWTCRYADAEHDYAARDALASYILDLERDRVALARERRRAAALASRLSELIAATDPLVADMRQAWETKRDAELTRRLARGAAMEALADDAPGPGGEGQ